MTFLFIILLVAVLALGYLYRASRARVRRRDVQIAELRGRLEHYLANDARLIDQLWNRAQAEVARAERAGVRL